MKHPLLIATLGYPGSGKTYFSEQIAKEYNLFHLNSDRIRGSIFVNPVFTPEEHKVVFGFMNHLLQELLRIGVGVIYDANSNKRFHRKDFAMRAKKYGAQYVLVHIQTPVELAEKRLVNRRNIKSKEKQKMYRLTDVSVLHDMKAQLELPTKDEPVIAIDGTKRFKEQLKEFKRKFKLLN